MHRRARRLALIGAVVATLALAAPVGAITNGQPDDGEHPYVGELFFYVPSEADDRFTDGGSWFNCSGTLISPTVVLTAGHCTFGDRPGRRRPRGRRASAATTSGSASDEEPDYTGISSAPYIPDDNAGRYAPGPRHAQRAATRLASRHGVPASRTSTTTRSTSHDAGVVILDEPRAEVAVRATLAAR